MPESAGRMLPISYPLARPFLFGLDPEHAHDLTLTALASIQRTPLARWIEQRRVRDPVTLAGLAFPNRVGLAAGLDKNGRCIDAFGAMGFGSIEVGTVTPLAQPGNPKPRMFRLVESQALINRMGFNNDGLAVFLANVRRARFRSSGGILGLNIGKNAATPIERATDDYLAGLAGVYPHADYVTVNVSSPNTKDLRSLQTDAALDALLAALVARRGELAAEHCSSRADVRQGRARPRAEADRRDRGGTAPPRHRRRRRDQHDRRARRRRRPQARRRERRPLGAPLRERSDRVIARLRCALGTGVPIIGVGGVMSADDARAKRAAGADLVQLYTGFIYRGPTLVTETARALAAA
jgi:dihydroorotate dehydrogenase